MVAKRSVAVKKKVSKPLVKVYSTPTCPYCVMVKDFFKQNKVPFSDVDVSRDSLAASEMIRISGQMGVPVVVIGTKVIIGFNKPAIMNALGLV